MSGEEGFLRALLANPEDTTTRFVYADWLEERGAAGAEILRGDPDLFRLSFLDWIEKRDSDRDYYIERHPELHADEPARAARKQTRQRVLGSGRLIRPSWMAFMSTLGSPFRPFSFWNNTGPRSFGDDCPLPVSKQLGSRGGLITFEDQFRDGEAWGHGLREELQLLVELEMKDCAYGAAGCPIHPFLCELPTDRWPLIGTDVLTALNAKCFRSQHIPRLDISDLDYPGYHPYTDNDEIHNRFRGQRLFSREDGEGEQDGPHGELKRHVAGEQLWYVLLHPEQRQGAWVLLFAVGKSRCGRRLIGIVSHQLCHNLCD